MPAVDPGEPKIDQKIWGRIYLLIFPEVRPEDPTLVDRMEAQPIRGRLSRPIDLMASVGIPRVPNIPGVPGYSLGTP